jgi:hypothetical protein
MQVLLFLTGILVAAIVAGLTVMMATPPDQAAHNVAAYFRAAELNGVATWIELHPGTIVYVLSGCLMAAVLCFLLALLFGAIEVGNSLWKWMRRRKINKALNNVYIKVNGLFIKSLAQESFTTAVDFYGAVMAVNCLVQQQLKGKIEDVELAVILNGPTDPSRSFSGGIGKGDAYAHESPHF